VVYADIAGIVTAAAVVVKAEPCHSRALLWDRKIVQASADFDKRLYRRLQNNNPDYFPIS